MTMRIKKLLLKNFRNYGEEVFGFHEGLNVLYGKNAQGKTNCAEAVFYLCTGASPRAKKDKQLIKSGEESRLYPRRGGRALRFGDDRGEHLRKQARSARQRREDLQKRRPSGQYQQRIFQPGGTTAHSGRARRAQKVSERIQLADVEKLLHGAHTLQ